LEDIGVVSWEFEYTGDYPELYSVALSSILGTRGDAGIPGPSPMPLQPNIVVIEEDDYGRVIFSYDEGTTNLGSPMVNDNRVIMQKTEGDYVYFYPHYNFISSSYENNRWEFTDEDIEALKDVNSWNQVMSDDSEFVRVRIVRQKERGPIEVERLSEVYNEVFSISADQCNIRDIDERMIFLGRMTMEDPSIWLWESEKEEVPILLFYFNRITPLVWKLPYLK
jgi:hypothetical protein